MSGTVTLDLEVIQQWLDWLESDTTLDLIEPGDELARLRADLREVLAHPERCQPAAPEHRDDGYTRIRCVDCGAVWTGTPAGHVTDGEWHCGVCEPSPPGQLTECYACATCLRPWPVSAWSCNGCGQSVYVLVRAVNPAAPWAGCTVISDVFHPAFDPVPPALVEATPELPEPVSVLDRDPESPGAL